MKKLTLVKMSAIVLMASVLAVLILALEPAVSTADELEGRSEEALVIKKQGSFFVGERTVQESSATFNPDLPSPFRNDGQTFPIDHLYAAFQIPPDARNLPLVFVHGLGQTGKTWESTPDGRDGYQTIFLRQGFSVYIVDFPRRGKAGFPSFTGPFGNLATGRFGVVEGPQVIPNFTVNFGDQAAFIIFRLGRSFLDYFPNTQFPKAAIEQFLRQKVPAVTDDTNVVTDALAALFDKIGPAILVTHSQSGLFGWLTAIKSQNVKAIVSYEPTDFSFPEREVPPPVFSHGIPFFPGPPEATLPLSAFMKLTEIPIQIVYGDNIPTSPDPNLGLDGWRIRVAFANQFAEAVNRHGGDASILLLPEAGLFGNTHFPFSDRNNLEVAGFLAQFLRENNLDSRGN